MKTAQLIEEKTNILRLWELQLAELRRVGGTAEYSAAGSSLPSYDEEIVRVSRAIQNLKNEIEVLHDSIHS